MRLSILQWSSCAKFDIQNTLKISVSQQAGAQPQKWVTELLVGLKLRETPPVERHCSKSPPQKNNKK